MAAIASNPDFRGDFGKFAILIRIPGGAQKTENFAKTKRNWVEGEIFFAKNK